MAEDGLSPAEVKALIRESIKEDREEQERLRKESENKKDDADDKQDDGNDDKQDDGTDKPPTEKIDVNKEAPNPPEERDVVYRSHGRIRIRRETVNAAPDTTTDSK